MKICLAQINPTIGAFKQNVGKICKSINTAREKGADLVIFPEMSVVVTRLRICWNFPDLWTVI